MHPDFADFFLGLLETSWREMSDDEFHRMILDIVAHEYGPESPELHEAVRGYIQREW